MRWAREPAVRSPVLIAAFAGWNDAGEGATSAVKTLAEAWHADPFADIDPEAFFDFTANRPQVRMAGGRTREIAWPSNAFFHASLPAEDGDAVLLLGTEPGLRWRTFCDEIIDVVRTIDARMVITLGALLAEVPHTRPVQVIGTTEDDDLLRRLQLRRSTYEGPTGVVGVLADALRRRGVPAVSLWAAVPTYVSGPASPTAALALIRRIIDLVGAPFDTTELETESAAYLARIDALVSDDEELRGFLEHMESDYDDEVASHADPADLIAEVERYLKDQ